MTSSLFCSTFLLLDNSLDNVQQFFDHGGTRSQAKHPCTFCFFNSKFKTLSATSHLKSMDTLAVSFPLKSMLFAATTAYHTVMANFLKICCERFRIFDYKKCVLNLGYYAKEAECWPSPYSSTLPSIRLFDITGTVVRLLGIAHLLSKID
jgi:hypothetical protein